jgi:histidyl-tRNA synthetase
MGLDRVREIVEVVGSTTGRDDLLCFDPSIVRGLDYYTGVVYEVKHETVPQVGSIGAGGRYDDLAGLFTKASLPGVGGTIGVSRILTVLDAMDRSEGTQRGRPLVVITQDAESSQHRLAALAAVVRGTGLYDVEIYPAADRHSAQTRYADARSAAYVLTIDDAETVSVKVMASGERHNVGVEGLEAFMVDRA